MRWLTFLLPLVALCGCQRSNLPPRAPVEGTVTLDGSPLPRGTVTFMPDRSQGTSGPIAVGEIDSAGHYQLSTDRSGSDGAAVGFHQVRVHAREAGEPGTATKSLIPEAYGDARSSGLTAEVKANQVNRIDLPLTSIPAKAQ